MKNEKNTTTGAGAVSALPALTPAAFELKLYAENTGRIYPQKLAIYKNLNKHNRRGNFDLERAAAAFMPWLVIAAKMYIKELCAPGVKYYTIFPRADRYAAAVALAAEYQAEYIAGNMAWLDAE